MADYERALDNAWEKMERLFFSGEFKPKRESDVQAFFYTMGSSVAFEGMA